MNRVCPYLGVPIEQRSPEHIFPDAIGGPDTFTVETDERGNHEFNRLADEPFLKSGAIRFFRVMNGIPPRQGEAYIEIDATAVGAGLRLPARLRLNSDGTHHPYILPYCQEVGPGQGWLSVVPESEEDQERLYRKKARKLKKNEEIYLVDKQEVHARLEFDPKFDSMAKGDILGRFLAKVALAGSARLMGDAWAPSQFAVALREVVRGTRLYNEPPLLGVVHVANQATFPLASPFIASVEQEHEMAFVPGNDGFLWCRICVFGFVMGDLRVDDSVRACTGWAVNYVTRQVRDLSDLRPAGTYFPIGHVGDRLPPSGLTMQF